MTQEELLQQAQAAPTPTSVDLQGLPTDFPPTSPQPDLDLNAQLQGLTDFYRQSGILPPSPSAANRK